VYLREDLGPDGTHPSESGRRKVAAQLLDFLKTDPTSKPWFPAN
jgi:lysophospholipase L1-like esterase